MQLKAGCIVYYLSASMNLQVLRIFPKVCYWKNWLVWELALRKIFKVNPKTMGKGPFAEQNKFVFIIDLSRLKQKSLFSHVSAPRKRHSPLPKYLALATRNALRGQNFPITQQG